MDTGIDWIHPALQANYRGSLGNGLFEHNASWFDAVNESIYPYDDYGHGTHVAGTAVGGKGIGVAPEARWIGIKVLSQKGVGYDSWIHAGFQWALAPGGDPAQAPDVLNASWGANIKSTTFQEDIEKLKAAGIFPVFSAGNAGPELGSVASPASLPGVFAIGASDSDDEVTYFSSRGPSPWDEVKPYVVAPGAGVLSAIPGGIYRTSNGTSMAAPHVSGLVAIIRSVSPTISIPAIGQILTRTAVPLTDTIPNYHSGWGRIDAFAALLEVTQAGWVKGSVQSAGGKTITGASIKAISRSGERQAQVHANVGGHYTMALPPGTYDLTARAFGYLPKHEYGLEVVPDVQVAANFHLDKLPHGFLKGSVTVSGTEELPTSMVVVQPAETPLTMALNSQGDYAFELPEGSYTVTVRGLGYRSSEFRANVIAGQTTVQDVVLTPAPKILVVDEGGWYYDSRVTTWLADLAVLRYTADTLTIKSPYEGSEIDGELDGYGIVLWSSPRGSPGLVKADGPLANYLQRGGKLLLSGQNAAYYDGGTFFEHTYMTNLLDTVYVEDTSLSRLVGRAPFDDITVTLAHNSYPDEVAVMESGKTSPLWTYDDDSAGIGGAKTSICVPYRSLFFAFNYADITDTDQRQDVLQKSLAWLLEPPLTKGLRIIDPQGDSLVGSPGKQIVYRLKLEHIGYAGGVDPVSFSVESEAWPARVRSAELSLLPCSPQTITLIIDVPSDAGVHEFNEVVLRTSSQLVPDGPAITLTAKTPAPILVVDDDRWYPMEYFYTSTLSTANVPFDLWSTQHYPDVGTDFRALSEVLPLYPITLWFTGYDWHRPITSEEAVLLLDYLAQKGRLLISSQDFLHYHTQDSLPQRLGVMDWTESTKVDSVTAVPDHPAGGAWGPTALDFPFQNWSDQVEPRPDAAPVIRGEAGQPVAIAAGSAGEGRSLFYSFPLETLPKTTRATVLARAVGWLSPLGTSRWESFPANPNNGDRVTQTLVLYNDSARQQSVAFTHTLPSALDLDPATLPPALDYDAGSRTLSWSGDVSVATPLTFTWAATVNLAGTVIVPERIVPTVTLALPEWKLLVEKESALYVGGSDLSTSRWELPGKIVSANPTTLTFVLENTGPGAVTGGQVRLWVTEGFAPITATRQTTMSWGLNWWKGDLAPGSQLPLSVGLVPQDFRNPVRVDALIEDGMGQRWERRLWLEIEPRRAYFPIVLRDF